MPNDVTETIAAIASAPGKAMRGIIRISGSEALIVSSRIVDKKSAKRMLAASNANSSIQFSAKIGLPDCSRLLQAEILVWPTRRSFTGQPSVEIHTIGSMPILHMVLQRLIAKGCRLAEPGEFTMRAFLSGRLDLTQAEAVLGMIDARNEKQFDASLSQMAGGIAEPVTNVKNQLVAVLAELEAGLDFVEEDIEFISNEQISRSLDEVAGELHNTIEQLKNRGAANEITQVTLTGKPNAGKSSLFNTLTKSQAIVSETAGTTRDYLTKDVTLEDVQIRLTDTAGLEPEQNPNADEIDVEMKNKANEQVRIADIVVHCQAVENDAADNDGACHFGKPGSSANWIHVLTKSDLTPAEFTTPNGLIATSSKSGSGIQLLISRIAELARELAETNQSLTESALRTTGNLEQALASVQSAKTAAETDQGEEVIAAEIRSALDEIGRIVGIIYTDDILDVVFSRFCIGK